MGNDFLACLKNGNNDPVQGSIHFDTSDHIRFQNGIDVSGHNYGCNRRFVIEKNINGGIGYTITMYNLDGLHPLWQNNIQMAPKQMKVELIQDNIIELKGFGYDSMGIPFSSYGVLLMFNDLGIVRLQLNMYDRNTCIVYFP